MDEQEAKVLYDLAKVTNTTKLITDDFNSSAILFIFKEYLQSIDNPHDKLKLFMDSWETSAIQQKHIELGMLANPDSGSMQDMAVGSMLANSEDLDSYADEVLFVKDIIQRAIVKSLEV